jgi:serine protease
MRSFVVVASRLVVATLALGCLALAQAAENNGPVRRAQPAAAIDPGRLLVVWNSAAETNKQAKLAAIAKISGVTVATTRELTPRIQLLHLATRSRADAEATLATLRADPRIRHADYDYRRFALVLPNDPGFANQWYLQAVQAAAIHAQVAWDVSAGATGIVIADLDTGVRYDHPDLARATAAGKLLPGYDFVSPDTGGGFLSANDGDGRDADASDPGDWITSAESSSGPFQGCDIGSSSWHGTRTAGLLGALSNNGVGIAGTDWNSYVLPVRVLGKCGGYDSDIIDGMRWAAGLSVAGAPANPYPARVINMSLGGTGACPIAYQSVFNELASIGVAIVVSAGNSGGPVAVPANCPGAIAVAGLRHIGTKVGFSSLGPEIALSAPGGNCVNASGACLFSIDTLTDLGTTTPVGPGYTDQINYNVGTSFSAPLVTGVAALMLSVNQNLQPAHIRDRLRLGATKPFPVNSTPDPITLVPPPTCHVPADASDVQDFECNCTTATCGAGMLNAQGAMAEALRPIASVALPASVSAGNNVSLGGNRSVASCGRTIATYQWTVTSGSAVISNADQANASVPAPGSGSITVRLVVTDNLGATDAADITITPTSATSNVPTITPVAACPAAISVSQGGAPTATLSASPMSVTTGQASTLTWASTNATGCMASGAWLGSKAPSGSQSTGALAASSTYAITCNGPGGASSTRSVTVTVTAAPMGGGGGGGGGGSLGLWPLLGLGILLASTRRPVRH